MALNPFLLVVSSTDRLCYENAKKKLIQERKCCYQIEDGKPIVSIRVDAKDEADNQRVTSTFVNLEIFIYIADDAEQSVKAIEDSLLKKEDPDSKIRLDLVRRVAKRMQ